MRTLNVLIIAAAFSLVSFDAGAAGNGYGRGGSKKNPVPTPTPTPPPPTPTPNPTPMPTPSATPSPTPGPTRTPSGSFPIIPSNFDVNSWIYSPIPIAGSGYPDHVGAFRFLCRPSHNLYDDPIVFPGQAGAAHLHTFFGNTMANAHSTYDSLRMTGDGTCDGGPVNRSAYWAPSMMNGRGKVVMPEYVVVYYKANPKPEYMWWNPTSFPVPTSRIPRGLRMVFGYNMKNYPVPVPELTAHALEESGRHDETSFGWHCYDSAGNSSPTYRSMASLLGAGHCQTASMIEASISTAPCWNGELDSPDHRSHLAYGKYGWWGTYKCPDTHPKLLPVFSLKVVWSHSGIDELKDWYLSSDRMTAEYAPAGSTFHSDWFGAWDDTVLDIWQDECIDKLLTCSAGNLGNGSILKRPDSYWQNPVRLVDPPPPPMMDHSTMHH